MGDLTIETRFKESNNCLEEIKITFSDDEQETINKYIDNCKRLDRAKLFITGPPNFKIKWDKDSGLKFEYTKYQYRDICELLHLARPVFLFNEKASFLKVKSLIGKKVPNTKLAKYLKIIGKTYTEGLYKPYLQITVKKIPLFTQETLNNWLNGLEYHQDEDKAVIIEEIKTVLSEDNAQSFFIAQLWGQIHASFMLYELILQMFKRKDDLLSTEGEYYGKAPKTGGNTE